MTIDEAINDLSEEVKHPYSAKKMSRPDAIKLGIEALKHLKDERTIHGFTRFDPLPGEDPK